MLIQLLLLPMQRYAVWFVDIEPCEFIDDYQNAVAIATAGSCGLEG